jgi:SAM-dependent methyltransferase
MGRKPMKPEHRTPEQIREHYEIEKELANRLRNASKHVRRHLYSALYDELYRRVPYHPQLTRKSSPQEREQAVSAKIRFLRPFLNKEITFLEIGPGDCALAFEVAKSVKQVYAVDVSRAISNASTTPENFRLILSDGCNIPVPQESVHVAYSNQLMEHLHPDDAVEHLQDIYRALTPGGMYICITPTRLTGPHDVSKYFDPIATGFHLKEYTISELSALFRRTGFSNVRVCVRAGGSYARIPVFPSVFCEKLLGLLPHRLRKSIARGPLFGRLLEIRLVAIR